jgi:hypothetical protein
MLLEEILRYSTSIKARFRMQCSPLSPWSCCSSPASTIHLSYYINLGCKVQKNIKARKETGEIAFRLRDHAEVRILYSVLILTGCALCSCANCANLIIT